MMDVWYDGERVEVRDVYTGRRARGEQRMSEPVQRFEASAGAAVPARPAAAVVLLRAVMGKRDAGIEVFMVRRHVRSEFVPDAYVFPGGTVKPDDAEVERRPGLCAPLPSAAEEGPTAQGSGFRAAALRECFEEAGVLLARRGEQPLAVPPAEVARFAAYRQGLYDRTLTLDEIAAREGLTLATDALLHWAHWITPESFPRRFDTHFFLAEMPAGQEAAHDRLETTEGVWVRPEEALTRFERGEFTLVFATIHQLRDLTGLASVAVAWARFAGRPVRAIQPRVERHDGVDTIVMPEDKAGA
jgi:8-oxo-dGTP pyrophosphatase MutT (NUDIX family)